MRTRRLALAAPLLLLLAACTTGGLPGGGSSAAPTDEPTDSGGSGGGPGAADCVVGNWSADVDDLAAQLLAFFQENGIPATSTAADGFIELRIAGTGDAEIEQDLGITVDADLNGMPLTLVQRHSGAGSGGWSVDADTLTFPDWDRGTLQIEQDVTLGGETFDLPIELPDDAYGDVPLEVQSCAEGEMVTKAEQSPFTTTWLRNQP